MRLRALDQPAHAASIRCCAAPTSAPTACSASPPTSSDTSPGWSLRRLEIMSETGLIELPDARRAARAGRHGAPALRRAARAHEGPARRDPRARPADRHHARRARRGRRRARPRGLRGARSPSSAWPTGPLPRLAAARATWRASTARPTCSCSRATASPAATSSSRRWAMRCPWWSATSADRATSSTTPAGSACTRTTPSSSRTTWPPPSAGSSTIRTLRTRMGAAARERVAETAVWDRKVEQLEALYDDLLPTRSA